MKQVITITFCDTAENHVGMEKLGQKRSRGFNLAEMEQMMKKLKEKGIQDVSITNLNQYLPQDAPEVEPAYFLKASQALNFLLPNLKTQADLHVELSSHHWDTKYYDVRRKKVLNKHARANVCYGETAQAANFEEKKGTVIAFSQVPLLNSVLENILNIVNRSELQAEGNFYTDGGQKKTGIGFHGDAERKEVVAIRTGNQTMPLHYQWYYKSQRVGQRFTTDIAPGDLYVMSEKAVGFDWKRSSIYTLRHATGANKYTK